MINNESDIEIGIIYENYADKMFSYGISFGFDKEIVKDAIHDVFLNFYELYCSEKNIKREKIRFIEKYLTNALRNRLLSYNRKYNIFETLKENVHYDFNIEVDAGSLFEEREECIRYEQKLKRLLQSLSPKQREIIYLRFIQGMDYEDIAEIQQTNVRNVRKIVYRSLKRMRENNIPMLFLLFNVC